MQICSSSDAICQRLQEIATVLASMSEAMTADPTGDRVADAGVTLFATLIGAALALLASWWIFRQQRQGDRSDRLDAMVATIVGSLSDLERAFQSKFAPLDPQVEAAFPGSTKSGNARSKVLGDLRVARIHANDAERKVLDAAFVHISARDWPAGREAQNAERVANILVAWREGTHDNEAAITELQGRYSAGPPTPEDLAQG